MTEHAPCPRCRHANPPEDRFCGGCGAPLAGGEVVPRGEGAPAATGRALPARLGPVGGALAVGAAALAAEVGLAWLRHRAGGAGRAPAPVARAAGPAYLVGRSLEEVLVVARAGNAPDRVFARRAVRSFVVTGPTVGRR